jgi:hypothetical protein
MNAQVYIERTDYCGHDAPIVSLCVVHVICRTEEKVCSYRKKM